MTKPIIVVKVPCKLLYAIQVKEFLIKCSTSWPYLISEFLVAYITIVASDWPRTFFTPKVFLFSICITCDQLQHSYSYSDTINVVVGHNVVWLRVIPLHHMRVHLLHKCLIMHINQSHVVHFASTKNWQSEQHVIVTTHTDSFVCI